jgi:cytochrome oxidase Cu insertion factor (SCO1/SenC/PrrC family)
MDPTMPKLPVFARSAAIVTLLILAAVATYFWWRQLPGRMEDGCNLHVRRCSAAVPGGGRVTLGIEPRPLAYSQPWRLTVALDEAAAEKVEIDFAGLDTPTTFNRVVLAPGAAGRFEGEATLPMCAFEPIDWQATVLLGTGEKRQSVPFVFNSDPAARPKSAPRQQLAATPGGGASMLRGIDGPFGAEQLRGYATVLFFSYTAAPPGCPQPLAVIDAALAQLSAEERARVRAVMVAIDPEGDAPERLQPELQARHQPNYRVVTGAGADLIGTARLYGAAFVPRTAGADGKPRIDHAMIYNLLDHNGRMVGQLSSQDPKQLAAKLREALARR